MVRKADPPAGGGPSVPPVPPDDVPPDGPDGDDGDSYMDPLNHRRSRRTGRFVRLLPGDDSRPKQGTLFPDNN